MKKQLKIFSALLITMMVTGCGGGGKTSSISNTPSSAESVPTSSESNLDSVSESNPESSVTPSSSLKENQAVYTVKVVYEDGKPVVNSEIRGQWCDDSSKCSPFSLGENGEFSKVLTKGNYNIHLFNLPDGYAYNPNVNKASATEFETTITLLKTSNFLEGNGTQYNSYVFQEGTYFAKNTNKKALWYSFKPSRPGIFSIESLADGLDTVIGYHGGNSSFIPNTAYEKDDDSGEEKNFKYEFTVEDDFFVHKDEADENGNPQFERDEKGNLIPGSNIIFSIQVKDDSILEPFAFTCKFEREYKPTKIEAEIMEVKEANGVYQENEDIDASFKQIALDGSVNVVYNETDKYYHVNSQNGPVLLANLKKESKYLDTAICYLELVSATHMFLLGNGTKDYTNFVETYANFCNSDGVTPVTKELKEFFLALAKGQKYFDNGGWIASQLDFTVAEENQWLYVCGYYSSIYNQPFGGQGTSSSPFNVDAGTYKFDVNGENATWFTLYALGEADYQISTNSASAVLLDNKNVELTTGEDGFKYIVHLEPRESVTLGVKLSNGEHEPVVIKIKEKGENEVGDRDDIIVGTNVVEVLESESFFGVECSFMAPEDGEYTFKPSDDNTALWSDDYKNNNYSATGSTDSFVISLEKDEVFPFFVGTADFTAGTCTFVIDNGKGGTTGGGDSENTGDFKLGLNEYTFANADDAFFGVGGEFIAPQDGNYKFTSVNNAFVDINSGEHQLASGETVTISLTTGQVVTLSVGCDDSTNYSCSFKIELTDGGSSSEGGDETQSDFKLGLNEYTFANADDAYFGVGGNFVAPEAGSYKFTSTNNAFVDINMGEHQLLSGETVTLELTKGQVVVLSVGCDDSTNFSCSFTIELLK